MSLYVLPREIKMAIMGLCTSRTLASLALVDKAISSEAEAQLYTAVSVKYGFYSGYKRTTPLPVLAQNKEKAALVQFLSIQYYEETSLSHDSRRSGLRNPEEQAPINSPHPLITALQNTSSLVDLRIRVLADSEDDTDSLYRAVSEVIGNGYFRLRSLCCPITMDLSPIVLGQPDLIFLGLYPLGYRTAYEPVRSAPTSLLITKLSLLTVRKPGYYEAMSPSVYAIEIDLSESIFQISPVNLKKTLQDAFNAAFARDIHFYRESNLPLRHITQVRIRMPYLGEQFTASTRQVLRAYTNSSPVPLGILRLVLDRFKWEDLENLRETLELVPTVKSLVIDPDKFQEEEPTQDFTQSLLRSLSDACPTLRGVLLPNGCWAKARNGSWVQGNLSGF